MSIQVQDLSKQYGVQYALDQVSFTVEKGQIVGLLGPNGAGKTTTMKIISGYMSTFGGEAHVNGMDVRSDPIELKKQIGYLPEHNPLYLDMYIREYLTFIARIYRLEAVNSKVDHIIERTGLTREQHKKIGSLSKGYRQRVGLAQAMIHDPSVLILDEPTSGLDPNQLVEIRQLIRDIATEKTIIFSSHIMQEVQALCERVLILNQGQLVADERTEVLERVLHKQRKIVVELTQSFEGNWSIEGIQEVLSLGHHRYGLVFGKTNIDPRLAIFDFVTRQGHKLLELREEKSSIEDVFQKLTT
ncbi:MAG: gliding motility-associated ABC transporter ATP-binding subunit GldA [Saprospiraceae bacterium]|nr:gliding motility-associated ABC transporter ATP-binding subunit GldA [Saprospiraceae bacterium]